MKHALVLHNILHAREEIEKAEKNCKTQYYTMNDGLKQGIVKEAEDQDIHK